jgi:ribosomal 50S subunit-associated protein YjgA (DUF615 family)
MPLEPSEMNPAMSPDMSSSAQGFDLPNGQPDHEGAMAKADLYKLANYSLKLFKKMDESTQLESWVQAKITKAADYMASVYHYLEYEMKFSEYGHHLDNSDTLSEGQRMRIKELLAEAKSKMKELKKQDAEKSKKVEEGVLSGGERACTECGGSGMVYEEPKAVPGHVKSKVEKYNRLTKATHAAAKRLDRNNNGIPDDEEMEESFGDTGDKEMKVGDTKKTRTGELTKTSTGVTHKNTSYKDDGDEISSNAKSGKGVKSHAKSQSSAEKKDRAPALKQSPKSAKTWGMKDGSKFDNRDKDVDEGMVGQGVYEAKKKGDGNLANNAKPYDKVTRGDVIAGRLGKDEKGGKKVKETAVSGAPQKSGISATATTTVPGMKATGADLKKAGASAALGEASKQTMSRAAKGHEKYGKAGMQALAKAGKEGKSLEPVKAKYNKYDESVESDDKKPCPPMSHVKKMCQDGKSVAEICKMHPDCDQKELKQMVADCKKKMDESKKIAAAAMWNNMKETTAYIAEKKAVEKKDKPMKGDKITDEGNAYGLAVKNTPNGEEIKINGKGTGDIKKESTEFTRMQEQLARLNRSENLQVTESSEVAQLRKLTKLLG